MDDRKKLMIIQKMTGVMLLLLGIFILIFSVTGCVPEDKDASPIFILFPLGVYLLVSRKCLII